MPPKNLAEDCLADHRLARQGADTAGNCHCCGRQYIDKMCAYVCQEGCVFDTMPFTFCEECGIKADQRPSEGTLELDRAIRLQNEARDLVEAEAETRAHEQAEEKVHTRAEIRSVAAEVVLEAEMRQVGLLQTIEADELRIRSLE